LRWRAKTRDNQPGKGIGLPPNSACAFGFSVSKKGDRVTRHRRRIVVESLDVLFRPRSLAVFGASRNPEKLGHRLLKNVLEHGFPGPIIPVNPSGEAILGLPSGRGLTEAVDLALISVPEGRVLGSVNEAASAMVRAVVILSSGFGETGEAGQQVERAIREIAAATGMRILGPNCMGVYNGHANLNATYFWDLPRRLGGVSFASQSGAYGGLFFREMGRRGLGVGKFASLGNLLDIDHADLLAYLAQDPETEVIGLFVEQVTDGRGFLEAGEAAARQKPVLAFKAGRTVAGSRAARSHTGSLAGDTRVFEAACRRAGILLAQETEDFFDGLEVLARIGRRHPEDNRVAILTISGGPSVIASDACEALGLDVPPLSAGTQASLRAHLPAFGAAGNPVDMTPQMSPAEYEAAFRTVLGSGEVSGALLINIGLDVPEFAEAAVHAADLYDRPVVACTSDTPKVDGILRDGGIPILPSPERAARAYRLLVRRAVTVRNMARANRDTTGSSDQTLS
jgi:acetyltransferase